MRYEPCSLQELIVMAINISRELAAYILGWMMEEADFFRTLSFICGHCSSWDLK
jgi:hypothetical protein